MFSPNIGSMKKAPEVSLRKPIVRYILPRSLNCEEADVIDNLNFIFHLVG